MQLRRRLPLGVALLAMLAALVPLVAPVVTLGAAATPSWSTAASLATARYRVAAAASSGQIYALGGWNGSALSSVEAYSPSTNQWTSVQNMTTARDGLAAATGSDGRIYSIGGSSDDGNSSFLSTVEVYTPSSNSWQSIASLPGGGRMDLGAAADRHGIIYAIGGVSTSYSSGANPLGTVEAYNPATNNWVPKASMPTPRTQLAVVAGPDGDIYAIGGWSSYNQFETTVERYDPRTDTWTCSTGDSSTGCSSSTLAPLPTGRYGLAAAVGRDGLVYAVGGVTGGFFSQSSTVVEAYNPNTNAWTTMPSLSFARESLAAATGSDGWLYAIGGWQGSGSVPSALAEDYPPPGTPTLKAGAFPVSCTFTYENGTTEGWRPETNHPSNSSYQDNTTAVVSSTAQNHTWAGAEAVEVDSTVSDVTNLTPYTGAEGLVALPGAQPSGFGTLWINPPAGTITDANANGVSPTSTAGFYAIGADGVMYVTPEQKVANAAGQWSPIYVDLSQWTGSGQVGARPPKPYQSFGILYQLTISGVNVGDPVKLYLDDVNFGGSCQSTSSATPTEIGTSTPTPTATTTSTALAATATPTATTTSTSGGSSQTFQVTPGDATTVRANVGSTDVTVDLPAGEPVATLIFNPLTTIPTTPLSTVEAPVPGARVAINVSDAAGHPITTQLAAPVTMTISFSPAGLNAQLARIYTIAPNGSTQELPTTITANGDGSYNATAQTTHFSPFVVYAPRVAVPVPQVYVPLVSR